MYTEPELLNKRLERLAMVLDEIMPDCALLVRDALELLKEQEPIVGHWISIPHKKARICNICQADEPYKFADDDADVYDFCPHCGAKMET